MLLDQVSLLTAIAFSSAALMVTMFAGWLAARRDAYMLTWSVGLLLVIGGVMLFGLMQNYYTPALLFAAFAVSLTGLTFFYAGAIHFRHRPVNLLKVTSVGFVAIVLTGSAFIAGLSGVGTIIANVAMGLILALTGRQYWLSRPEAPLPMIAITVLYFACALSFALCAIVPTFDQLWILSDRPQNWAEDLNAITVIIGLTGIGALSLTLNQSRAAHHHRIEAMTDSLTGLLNRRALFERFADGQLGPGMAVIMFDIDHFKAINDEQGHAAGDVVLASFARLLQGGLRGDDVAARLGGEEFCAVVPTRTKYSAATVAERIRAAFEMGSENRTGAARTTVSAGVAISSPEGEAFETVLRRADEALYNAKAAGRNRVHAPLPRLVA